MRWFLIFFVVFLGTAPIAPAQAQQEPLNFATIERPPFAFERNGQATGFSIELMRLIAADIGRDVEFTFVDQFPQMLDAVIAEQVDGAVANISITSEREAVLDFTGSIYDSGLQIMVSGAATSASIWSVIFRWEVFFLVLSAFGVLLVLGLLMWLCERRYEGYFKLEGRRAVFPSFWWALNLVLNGGFEVNMPRSTPGRFLGVAMVVASLFVVSIFVANFTAALTVGAISGSIQTLSDLNGRQVGTTQGSTASAFLNDNDIRHAAFADFQEMIDVFEREDLDAVVFDAPLLAFYLANAPHVDAQILDRVFRAEDYGIALPQGSALREPINRTLLSLTETGQYRALRREWFGDTP